VGPLTAYVVEVWHSSVPAEKVPHYPQASYDTSYGDERGSAHCLLSGKVGRAIDTGLNS
jgi:hypothetical protein